MDYHSFKDYITDDADMPLSRKMRGEGGNAIKSSVRIDAENIRPTVLSVLEQIVPEFRISMSDIALLGSTNKKEPGQTAGDLDIGISMAAIIKNNKLDKHYDALHIVENFIEKFSEYKAMRAINVYSFACPIVNEDGHQTGEVVQCDLMPVSSLHLAKWTYYAPRESESRYKGLYRNEVIYAILKNTDFDVISKDLSGEPTIWKRYTLDLSRGLFRNKQKRITSGGIRTIDKVHITNSPEEITKLMFGDKVLMNEILTFEQIVSKIFEPDFIHRDKLDKILSDLDDGIKSKRVPYPDYLKYRKTMGKATNGSNNQKA